MGLFLCLIWLDLGKTMGSTVCLHQTSFLVWYSNVYCKFNPSLCPVSLWILLHSGHFTGQFRSFVIRFWNLLVLLSQKAVLYCFYELFAYLRLFTLNVGKFLNVFIVFLLIFLFAFFLLCYYVGYFYFLCSFYSVFIKPFVISIWM